MVVHATLWVWEKTVSKPNACSTYKGNISVTGWIVAITGHHNFIALHEKLLPHQETLWCQTPTQCNRYCRTICFSEDDLHWATRLRFCSWYCPPLGWLHPGILTGSQGHKTWSVSQTDLHYYYLVLLLQGVSFKALTKFIWILHRKIERYHVASSVNRIIFRGVIEGKYTKNYLTN